MFDLKECPLCGNIRQKTGKMWCGLQKKQTYRCTNLECTMYGHVTMKIKAQENEK